MADTLSFLNAHRSLTRSMSMHGRPNHTYFGFIDMRVDYGKTLANLTDADFEPASWIGFGSDARAVDDSTKKKFFAHMINVTMTAWHFPEPFIAHEVETFEKLFDEKRFPGNILLTASGFTPEAIQRGQEQGRTMAHRVIVSAVAPPTAPTTGASAGPSHTA